jgi:basic membrane protein A
MKKLYLAIVALLIASMMLASCAPATEAPTEAPMTEAPTEAMTEAPTEAPTEAMTEAPTEAAATIKVGVVTDVGQLEDKSFNQASYEGAQAAAESVGAEFEVIVTQNISDYKQNIQTFIDQGFNVIVTVGFLIGTDTTIAAKENPDVTFIGVDQGICVDETGAPDATFTCAGDAATLLPNYQGIVFAEEQAGYLAGIVAASISETGTIGAIGGTNVPAVVAYNAGYVAGAKSINPDIVTLYQETNPDPAKRLLSSSLVRAQMCCSRLQVSPDKAFSKPPVTPISTASVSTSTRLRRSRTCRAASLPALRRSSRIPFRQWWKALRTVTL